MRQRLRTVCIDEANQHAPAGWDQRVLRLERGAFEYEFERLRLANGLQLERASFVGSVRLDGALVDDAVHILFPCGADVRMLGIAPQANLVVVTPPSRDFVATASGRSAGVNVQLSGTVLHDMLRSYGVERPLGRVPFLAGGNSEATELRRMLIDAIAAEGAEGPFTPEAVQLLQREVVAGVASLLGGLQGNPPELADRAKRRREIAIAASRMVRERAAVGSLEDISQSTVCSALGVAPRTLQLAFQESFGVGYRAYERAVRLEQAHRLLGEARGTRSVTSIALECGFWHVGRFAAYYRSVYGASPSAEQARVPARRARHATSI